MGTSGTGTPCGACKFLRRKCTSDCVFAPYFSNEHGASRFTAIHKVFGASNASKLLLNVPERDRCEAVVSIAYEAQARLRDPVHGCVAHIFALQQQVASLQAQLMHAKAQLAHGMVCSMEINQCQWNNNIVSQGSRDSIDNSSDAQSMGELCFEENLYCSSETWNKSRATVHDELSELQSLAFRMMRNQ